jgi:Domain of unknown function (DUF6249)
MSSLLGSFAGLFTAVIPIVAIVGGISFAAFSMYLKVHRQREALHMYHLERMAAIEKGIELPPLPPELLGDRYDGVGYRGDYRRWRRGRGLTLVFIGAAVTVAMWQVNGDKSFWWGLIIVAAGLGRLVSEYLEGPGAPPRAGNGPVPPDSPVNR